MFFHPRRLHNSCYTPVGLLAYLAPRNHLTGEGPQNLFTINIIASCLRESYQNFSRHSTVLQAYRVLCVFVCSELYFLQYSSEKSQSWQECRQVTLHHSCRVKMFSKSNHVGIWCCLLPQFVVVCWFVVPNLLSYIFCTECLKCFTGNLILLWTSLQGFRTRSVPINTNQSLFFFVFFLPFFYLLSQQLFFHRELPLILLPAISWISNICW